MKMDSPMIGQALGLQLAAAVKEYFQRAITPITLGLKNLEDRFKDFPLPLKGETGPAGRDGKDADADAIYERVLRDVTAHLPVPRDGKDADPVITARLIEAEALKAVAQAMANLPPAPPGDKGETGRAGRDGADGREGIDGVQGPPGRDAVDIAWLPSIDESKVYARGTFAQYRGGMIFATRMTDPITNGLDKAGWAVCMNGVLAETEEHLDERRVLRVTEYTDGRTFKREMKSSALIYRGTWREQAYSRGDVVTLAGCSWHCQVDGTVIRPGTTGSDDWKLMVKAGRDGKEGQPGKSGTKN